MPLHEGVALDWGCSGASDEATVTCIASTRPTSTILRPPYNETELHIHRGDAVEKNIGVNGEEAMAQALIAGRAEQAILEERLLAREQNLVCARREALRLRNILERWHGKFVTPAMEMRRLRPRAGAATVEGAPTVALTTGGDQLAKKLLAATADLLGAREEAAGLRTETTALRALVAKLRDDEVSRLLGEVGRLFTVVLYARVVVVGGVVDGIWSHWGSVTLHLV